MHTSIKRSLSGLALASLVATTAYLHATQTTPVVQAPTGQTYSVQAPARVMATPNRHRGIPPCREEDGSGQRAMCVWDDGQGDVVVNKSTRGGDDVTIVLVDRTPRR